MLEGPAMSRTDSDNTQFRAVGRRLASRYAPSLLEQPDAALEALIREIESRDAANDHEPPTGKKAV